MATRIASAEPHGTLSFAVNDGGSAAAAPDSDEPASEASRSRTSASVMAPSRTALCLPYMNPPFSSNPTSAPLSTIARETSTLPTLVRTTVDPEAAEADSIADPEFRHVTTVEPGEADRSRPASSSAERSPVSTAPRSSQNRLLSPSPSNATPTSAPDSATARDSPPRFSGVGSGPRPGNPASIVPLTTTVRQPSRLHSSGAVFACAPFPASIATVGARRRIAAASTSDMIPSRYVSTTSAPAPSRMRPVLGMADPCAASAGARAEDIRGADSISK